MTTCAVKVDYAASDRYRPRLHRGQLPPARWASARCGGCSRSCLPYPRRFAQALRLAKLARPVRWYAAAPAAQSGRSWPIAAAGRRRVPAAGRLSGRRPAADARRAARRLRAAGARSQHQCRDDPAAAAPRLRGRGCARARDAAARCRCIWGAATQGRRLARANIAAWSRELATGLDAVVVNASGCGTTVKDYGHFVGGEAARRIGALARDVTELLCEHRHDASTAVPSRIASPITMPARCSTASV